MVIVKESTARTSLLPKPLIQVDTGVTNKQTSVQAVVQLLSLIATQTTITIAPASMTNDQPDMYIPCKVA